MKQEIKKWAIVSLMLICTGFFIAHAINTINDLTGCEYCTNPVERYEYDSEDERWDRELYPINKTLNVKCALECNSYSGEDKWYLNMDDGFMADDFPPSSITSYYWINVEYCPWCGQELN